MSRVDCFVKLPEAVNHKVEIELDKHRSFLASRLFSAMTPRISRIYYFTTMELIKEMESPSLAHVVKTVINPVLEPKGYRVVNVVPEKAIVDDYGYKSRQRFWGFVQI
ncbi:hypothetical protein JHT19_16800 [Vibrio parahaemolyticus]|uniref:Uncharacterized protein n=1 Tax=Vibrio parahaemolyticus TaxID=670 RepID=A0A7Z2MW92_VIBPH|nr:hypothetical protein [Vibrio parahaemolyticus]EJC6864583.1 hypothetical protein [Vibrio parahaemolyticus]EJC7042192.1 hypothetical protein [Vibrio parahaemolyticus]MCR9645921.1 hypothetical protein [Vibrio parahaemolyticus]MCR9726477.1 hypothetical protein [Vibrio parahaemolyticus]MCR9744987.1 hypothetical protein [Vibrio parahaemolyticus]